MFLTTALEELHKNICSFRQNSLLRKGISMYFANYFDLKSERERFTNYFETIDTDNDGLLSYEEIVIGYSYKVHQVYSLILTLASNLLTTHSLLFEFP